MCSGCVSAQLWAQVNVGRFYNKPLAVGGILTQGRSANVAQWVTQIEKVEVTTDSCTDCNVGCTAY